MKHVSLPVNVFLLLKARKQGLRWAYRGEELAVPFLGALVVRPCGSSLSIKSSSAWDDQTIDVSKVNPIPCVSIEIGRC